jgi:hypothetical protein
MMRTAVGVLLPMLAVAPDAIQRDSFGSEWSERDGVVTKTFYSPAVSMRPGQIIMNDDIQMGFVDEPAAITNIASDLVDEQGRSVPLSEAYVHHWLLEGASGRNSIRNSIGAGSEYRGLPEGFKKPFALMVGGDERWEATLHLLDLRLTPPNLKLPSLECRRRTGKPRPEPRYAPALLPPRPRSLGRPLWPGLTRTRSRSSSRSPLTLPVCLAYRELGPDRLLGGTLPAAAGCPGQWPRRPLRQLSRWPLLLRRRLSRHGRGSV